MSLISVMLALAAACLMALAGVAWAPPRARTPLVLFNGFYLLTTVIGATLIVNDGIRAFWMLSLPGMDAGWLAPGRTAGYWIVLLGPFLVVNAMTLLLYPRFRRPTFVVARLLRARPDLLTCWIVGFALVAYCIANLAKHGYLGASIVDPASAGMYRMNIQLRTQMARELGGFHFALLYMTIPSVCIVALHRAARGGGAAWWLFFLALSGSLVALYMTTFTKANVLIFGVAVVTAAATLRLIRFRGIVFASLGGLILLTLLDFLLSGGGLWEVVGAMNNLVFRIASGFPFYMEVFPDQVPYVGIDLGLGRFGIGMTVPPNLVIYEYMYPADTWVQGAAPAPAHVSAYAQAGPWWSLMTMTAVAALCAFATALQRFHRSALAFSAFVGLCVSIYYATQTDFVGVFDHSYGFKWWVFGLAVLAIGQRLLEASATAKPNTGHQADHAKGHWQP